MVFRWRVSAPLNQFDFDGDEVEFANGILIRRAECAEEVLSRMRDTISQDEYDLAQSASHWICFECLDDDEIGRSEIVNLVLLSLWMVRSSWVDVRLVFSVGLEDGEGHTNRKRFHDHFQSVAAFTNEEPFRNSELECATRYFEVLCAVRRRKGRVHDALLLTIAGCWAVSWQVPLICFSAAAETLLTYSRARGLTRRLATSFATLMEVEQENRDRAFEKFERLYGSRSDVTHGRMHEIDAANRLQIVSEFTEMLRTLWQRVLEESSVMENLEGADENRANYFARIIGSYAPPQRI